MAPHSIKLALTFQVGARQQRIWSQPTITSAQPLRPSWCGAPVLTYPSIHVSAPGPGRVIPVQVPHQGRIALVRSGQGWTGPLGPRSRRIDCMIANVVVQVKISMSAPPRTPLYFAMTGAAARSVTASRWALTAAHTFSP